jgi:hypothetical protein
MLQREQVESARMIGYATALALNEKEMHIPSDMWYSWETPPDMTPNDMIGLDAALAASVRERKEFLGK